MRKFLGLFIVIILLLSVSIRAQNVLDGFYFKEKIEEKKREPVPRPVATRYDSPQQFNYTSTLDSLKGYSLRNGQVFFGNRYLNNSKLFIYADTLSVRYYVGKPIKEIEETYYFNPGEMFFKKQNGNWLLHQSLRYYMDTSNMHIDADVICYTMDSTMGLSKFLQPFYFGKHEVTNKEYREFVNYVRDSLIRETLADNEVRGYEYLDKDKITQHLNWAVKLDTYSSDRELQDVMQEFLRPDNERYYRRREWDVRKFNFRYHLPSGKLDIINVYPDTLVWVNDFSFSFNEPMTNMYFWHPAYDDYPVVGISYLQARAFLIWKTEQEQKKLNETNPQLKIIYDLPSVTEWEYMNTYYVTEDALRQSWNLMDYGWVTDLTFTNPDNKNTYHTQFGLDSITNFNYRNNDLLRIINGYSIPQYIDDDPTFHTKRSVVTDDKMNNNKKAKERITYFKNANAPYAIHDENSLGIKHMGNNLSEWMNETYADNWKPFFTYRQHYLSKLKDPESPIISSIEKYYDTFNDTTGQLVIGSNWWDERFSSYLTQNPIGSRAKTFVSKDAKHCTIGFRYVIRVTLKSEEKLVK